MGLFKSFECARLSWHFRKFVSTSNSKLRDSKYEREPISIADEPNFEMITNPRQPTPISLIFLLCVVVRTEV